MKARKGTSRRGSPPSAGGKEVCHRCIRPWCHPLRANTLELLLQGAKTAKMNSANTVTKDFLLFSQPMLHEGALLSSARCVSLHMHGAPETKRVWVGVLTVSALRAAPAGGSTFIT